MARRNLLYEGKAKILYEGEEDGTLIQYFKDDVTAFNSKKKSIISGKGAINNRISEFLFHRLSEISIPTHLIRRLNMREQLVRQLDIVPIEVVVHNIVAGSIAKRLGIARGTRLQRSIVEFFLKDDSLQDPMVTEEHITAFGWAAPQDIDDMTALALRTNDFLQGYFLGCGFVLVDFKIEFGRLFDDTGEMRLLLADEISPDSMRLWDLKSKDSFDKDVFREDRGDLSVAYREVARRMGLFERDEDLAAESLE